MRKSDFLGILWGLTVALFLAVYSFAGSVEGRYFPVVTAVEIYNPQHAPPPTQRTIWEADAVKLRDCEYRGIEWWLGPVEGPKVRVPVQFLDKPSINGPGALHWDLLAISLHPSDTIINSHAYVLHDCGWPWLTKSLFFEGKTSTLEDSK